MAEQAEEPEPETSQKGRSRPPQPVSGRAFWSSPFRRLLRSLRLCRWLRFSQHFAVFRVRHFYASEPTLLPLSIAERKEVVVRVCALDFRDLMGVVQSCVWCT